MIKSIKEAPARSMVTFRNGNIGIVDNQNKVYDLDNSTILTGYENFVYHSNYSGLDIVKVTDPSGKVIYWEELWETVDMNKFFEKLNAGKPMAFKLHYKFDDFNTSETYCHCDCKEECYSECRFEENTRSGSGNIVLSNLLGLDKIEILE
ncbi:MAG: hypothetical protein ACM3O3_05135 [Syntrophothermus sp.]